ncbi:type III ribulose-bisphosphate carboxylase [Candidatus Methanodesulfokora washburnensis]|jgi:ribulose-bisphosphate carboxylase large chain|uniref:Ribulose bisphosphate carboxylase n=1 Tax=Candidatus Methanodesulfokora washburnensis TaxID=2478471 RepID=A0A429GGY7_9CREN|nr:type III ribulose-bisphosphate carboxylase [Candidatus Methanodesulfokores washburnensis]RSN73074.1 type III ribulose-bisphosphate carboxylase [Candidatus Methanodesulfokores washburnensis]
MAYSGFVDLSHIPEEDELVALFYVEPAEGISVEEAAARVASESSNGTWTDLPTMSERIRKLSAKVFKIDGKWFLVSYPVELFELGNMPQIWSSIAGNIFGMKAVSRLRLEDVFWPKDIVRSFKGPKFGLNGVKNIMKVEKRPILATVPKPKVGMTSEEQAEAAYEIWCGGVDLLKDDENLTSQSFNRFERRIRLMMEMRRKAEKETGEKKSYLVNITAPYEEMKRRLRLVADYGNEFVMVDILTAGWSALQSIRDLAEENGLALHAHRAFHAAFDRIREHGVSMKVVAESARLIGVDNIHIGTVVGKLESPLEEVMSLIRIIRDEKVEENWDMKLLRKDWLDIKPVMPVSSGGLHPGLIPEIMRIFGGDVIIQAGGGVLGHPDGPKAGAKALRQAMEAVLEGVDLEEYAKKHQELRRALEKWGYMKPV